MVYGTYNYSYWGESKPTYNWGASHCNQWTILPLNPLVNNQHCEYSVPLLTTINHYIYIYNVKFSIAMLNYHRVYILVSNHQPVIICIDPGRTTSPMRSVPSAATPPWSLRHRRRRGRTVESRPVEIRGEIIL